MSDTPQAVARQIAEQARALADQIDDAAVKYDWQGGPSYAATIEPFIASALTDASRATPICECGCEWDAHTGHTVAMHLPEREQHDTHCACCYNCGAYRPSQRAAQEAK